MVDAEPRDRRGDGARSARPGSTLLDALDADARLAGHYRLDAVRAHLLEMAGDHRRRHRPLSRAAARTTSIPERNYLTMKARPAFATAATERCFGGAGPP